MGFDCYRCSEYLPHINTALAEHDMNCPLRIASFLAQVRHETAGFRTMYQPLDNGAGSIHMLPHNFRAACRAIPALRTAIQNAFPGCGTEFSDPCACGNDAHAGTIVQQPEYTFRVGVWWFVRGSREILTAPCDDLRVDSDAGLGSPGAYTRGTPGTGFHKVSSCIYGFVGGAGDAGLPQRIRYYTAARRAFEPEYLCNACQPGEFEIQPCLGDQARECSRCPPCNAGTYETSPCTDTEDRVCSPCSGDCGVGTFLSAACTTRADRTCTACSAFCVGGMFARTACTTTSDMVCEPCKWTCPSGTFKSADCTTDHDIQCTACTVCGEDEVEVSACTATADAVCQDANSECVAAPWDLTLSRLTTIMGGTCPDCAAHLPHIKTALTEGKMGCRDRTVAFLSQVRHETAALSKLIQPIDNGAGAIHMIPNNARLACADIPELRAAMLAELGHAPGCTGATTPNPCICGSDAEMAAIVARPEHAYRTGVWWFKKGSKQVLGDPCGDLRQDADLGAGTTAPWISKWSPGTGFYKISTCIWGFGVADPGRAQRMIYYLTAMRAFEPTFACTDQCDPATDSFLIGICTQATPTTCKACTKCWSGQIEEVPCTTETDRVCSTPTTTTGSTTTTGTTTTTGGSTTTGGGTTGNVNRNNDGLYSGAPGAGATGATVLAICVAVMGLAVAQAARQSERLHTTA